MEEEQGPSDEALLAALRQNLAAAGGPLADMDPQQLLEYVRRMAAGEDHGDDIAGEMAEALLEGEDEEDEAGAGEKVSSWVAQQRPTKPATQETPTADDHTNQPPTPPSSEANRSVRLSESTTKPVEPDTKKSLKRKADEVVEPGVVTKVVKKRVMRSFDAPTASSQAKAAPTKVPAKAERTLRGRRS
jgi:hypothetical protein